LDSTGKSFSKSVSEVDVTDPEDVKALLPGGSSEVLVHFGDEQFLGRYNEFERHLPEWQQQYPKLASADMRYEGQIVLEMRKDGVGDVAGNAGLSATSAKSADSGRDEKSLGGGRVAAAAVKAVAQTRVPEAGPGACGCA
jgi:cell division protein FtsQ